MGISRLVVLCAFTALSFFSCPFYAQADSESQWEIEVVDEQAGHDLGKFASLAIGSDSMPRIAYIDANMVSTNLLAVKGDLDWDIIVGNTDSLGYISLALDNQDRPHMTYSANGAGNSFDLVYSSSPGDGTWGFKNIFNAVTFGNIKDKDIYVDHNDRVYISFHDDDANGGMIFVENNTNHPWWMDEYILTDAAQGSFIGNGNSLAMDDNGNIYVTYLDKSFGKNDIKCHKKYKYDTVWSTLSDGHIDVTVDMKGERTCVAVAENSPHAIYTVNDNINVAWYADGHWVRHSSIDTEGSPYISIDARELGKPHIAYYSMPDNVLKHGYFDGEIWHTEVVDNEGDVGMWPSIKIDPGGNVHIAYYDLTNARLKYAFLSVASLAPIPELSQDQEIRIGNNLMDMNDSTQNTCRIMYNLSRDQSITIKVYDLSGNLIQTILEKVTRSAGEHGEDIWDGKNLGGVQVNPGIYYVVVEGDNWQDARKIAIVKESDTK